MHCEQFAFEHRSLLHEPEPGGAQQWAEWESLVDVFMRDVAGVLETCNRL